MCRLSWYLGASASWNPQGMSRLAMGLLHLTPSSHSAHCLYITKSDMLTVTVPSDSHRATQRTVSTQANRLHSALQHHQVSKCNAVTSGWPVATAVGGSPRDSMTMSRASLQCWLVEHELYIKIQSVPRSKHSVSVIQTSQLMLYREIIAVCSQIHTKHTNTLWGQNVELLNVKPGGTYSKPLGFRS